MLYLTIQACEKRRLYQSIRLVGFFERILRGSFQHLRNTRYKKRVGPYPVDGYNREDRSIYQFHGFIYICELIKNNKEDVWLVGRQKCLKRTKSTTQYVESQGFHVVEM